MNTLLMVFRGLPSIVDTPAWALLLLKMTAILLAAWCVHLALRRTNPRWRVFLWRATTIGLIVLPVVAWLTPALEIRVKQSPTTSQTVRVPGESLAFEAQQAVTENAPIGLSVGRPDAKTKHAAPMTTDDWPVVDAMASSQSQPLASTAFQSSLVTWLLILATIWLGWIAVLGFRLVVGHYRILQMVRLAHCPPQRVCDESARVADAIGCRASVKLLQSASIASPFLCGLRRPLLLLPSRMCDDSYGKDLPGILAHELTHVRSHDILWNLGLQLISIVLWPHPLVWQIRKAHLAACELVCDAVSANFVGNVADYCRTLARVAVEVYAPLPTAGIAMARTSAISRRLNALKERVFHLPLRRRSVLGFGFSVLLAVTVVGALQFAAASAPSKAGTDLAIPQSGQQTTTETPKGLETQTTVSEGSTKPGFRPMQIHVSNAAHKPIPNASITVRGMTSLPFGPFQYHTDTSGNATVEAPKENATNYQILVMKNNDVTVGAAWNGNDVVAQVPADIAFTLEQGTAFGGIVRDEQGKPVVGAEVTVDGRKGRVPDSFRWISINDTAKTDAEGKWQVHRIPKDLTGFEWEVRIKRPDIAGIEHFDEKTLSIKRLRDQTAVFVLRKGIVLEGIVTDPQGKPAVAAAVGLFPEAWPWQLPTNKNRPQRSLSFRRDRAW